MEFNIIRYQGTDKCKIGMKSTELEKIFNEAPRKFKKLMDDDQFSDNYGFCQIFYDENGNSEAMEFSSPAKVFFNNLQLIGADYIVVEEMFKELDNQLDFESGLCSKKVDIGIYCPDAPKGKVEAVLVGKKGYYSE